MSVQFDLSKLPCDPGLRPRIMDYDPNIREEVRRQYYVNGPCQPRKHDFAKTKFGEKKRRFVPHWFDEYLWVEYSITKEVAFCFFGYLFKNECVHQGSGDAFVRKAFQNWKKKERFREHVGGHNSSHSQAYSKCRDLHIQPQHIVTSFYRPAEQRNNDSTLRLKASVNCCRWLSYHGLPFRGHDESKDSTNPGLFIDLLQFFADNNKEVGKFVLDNSRGNVKLITSKVQKEIVNVTACETTNVVINELDGGLFVVRIDEARDVSRKNKWRLF